MYTFNNLVQGFNRVVWDDNGPYGAFKGSLLGSCMIGFIIVLYWIVFSFFILLGRFCIYLPMGYGMMVGSCTHTGFFMLLAGLVLQTHEDLAEQFQKARLWSSRDFTTYQATYAFSYILCGTYIIMFFLLIFAKGEMQAPERASSYEKKPSKSAASTSPPAAIAMGSTIGNGSATTNGHSNSLAPIPNNHGFGSSYGAYGNTV